MSKFGWDLPPGVTTSMLPGNTPAEAELEARLEAIFDRLVKAGIHNEDQHEVLANLIMDFEDKAYTKGREDERADAEMERAAMEMEKDQ